MAKHGFLHYEISIFCKPGMHSRHNASYWFGTPYAGFGPSAHSYDGVSRQWNVPSLEQYVEAWSLDNDSEDKRTPKGFPFSNLVYAERTPGEGETLTPEQQYDEYVMLRLRTMWGIDLKYLKREMGERFSTHCEQKAQPLVAQGRLSQTREFLYLTDEQMLFADGIAEALFW